jgi:NitT/TauT family transport system substrate-binding protein
MIHMPMYIALDRGFFKEEAIEAEIISLEGGVGTARALTAKAVDVASTSADPLIASAAAGGEIIGVYTYAPRVTNAMIGGAKVKTLADLKGKIIGIQEKNGFADVVSRLVLSKAGVKENEVTFLSTSTAGRLPALLAGQVDTGILHIEQVYKAMEENPSLNFVSRLWEADPLWWYSAYAMNKETIKNDPDVAERFVRAIIKSTRWMYKPENKAQVVESYLKFNKGFTKELADKTYDDIVKAKQWPMNEGVSREIVEHTVKTQMELGILKTDKAPTYEQLYDRTFIDKVLKELGKDGDAL